MFDPNTVLVLGAGASYDHGFPLGPDLKLQVQNLARSIARYPAILGTNPTVAFDTAQIKIIAEEFDRLTLAGEKIEISTIRADHLKFADRLQNAKSSLTIDAFLRDNPSMANLGRFYIALELYSRTYMQDARGGKPYIATTIINHNEAHGWYHKLVGALRDGCKNKDALEASDEFQVFTFNYDKSLELYLDYDFGRTEEHLDADYRKVVKINHLYGGLPELDLNTAEPIGRWLLNAALENYESIRIIGERTTEEQLAYARNSIENANLTIIVGFGFDSENCRQIGLPDGLVDSRLHLHNYDRDSPSFRGIEHLFEDWARIAHSSKGLGGPSPGHSIVGAQATQLANTLDKRRVFYEPISHAISAGLFRTR